MSATSRDAARWYLGRGWAPTPVHRRSKRPVLQAWQKTVLAEDEIERHFGDAQRNVGVLLGAPSGNLADLDLDAPEARTLADAVLPATGACFGRAASPRSHRLYAVDGSSRTERFEDPTKDQGDERAMLVELRGTGAQTLFPPSVHPSGDVVTWVARGEPGRVAAAELRRDTARLAAASLLARHWPGTGARQEAALALAGALLHAGWDAEAAATLVGAVARAAGDEEAAMREATARSTAAAMGEGRPTTGWPRLGELVGGAVASRARAWLLTPGSPAGQSSDGKTADSAETAMGGADGDAPWEPPAPLPEGEQPLWPGDVLPESLAGIVRATAWATQTPEALAAFAVLGALAAVAAKRVAVVVRPGWREPVNLFLLVALPPGNRKSAVMAAATAPVRGFEAAEGKRLAVDVSRAGQRRQLAEDRIDKLRSRAAGEDDAGRRLELQAEIDRLATQLLTDPELRVPVPPRLLVDDVTPEKLAALMAEQGGRLAVLSAEGGLFGTIAGRYSDRKADALDLFLKSHAGEDLPIDRIGRPAKHLVAPALTIGLAIQPEVLAGLAGEKGFRATGLLARFAYARPASTVGRRVIAPEPVPEEISARYEQLLLDILALPQQSEPDGTPRPRDLVLEAAAEARMRRFEADLEPRLGPDGDLGHVADWAAKLAGLVARLAGLLHVAGTVGGEARPWESEIGLGTLDAAVRVAEAFLIPHALSVFAEMGADPSLLAARKVARVLAGWPDAIFTKRDLHRRSLKGSFPTAAALDRPLALLAEHGYVRPLPPPARLGAPGRPPSPAFAINPLWAERNLRNRQNNAAREHTGDCAESASPSDRSEHLEGTDRDGWANSDDPGVEEWLWTA